MPRYWGTSVTVDGVQYKSIQAASLAHGLNPVNVRARLYAGWSAKEAFEKVPRRIPNKRHRGIEGVVYVITNSKTKKKYIGVTTVPLTERWTKHVRAAKEDGTTLLARAIRNYGAASFKIRAIAKGTLDELPVLERSYVSRMNTRHPNGYNMNQAGHTISGVGLGVAVRYSGKRWNSYAEMCRHYGMRKSDLCRRLKRGESISRALQHRKRGPKTAITFKGSTYPTLVDAAIALGVNPNTAYRRRLAGWPLHLVFSKQTFTKATVPQNLGKYR